MLGRSLVNNGHARRALKALSTVSETSPVAWPIAAARADAHAELGHSRAAEREAKRALELSHGAPQARFHAARVSWHINRVWDALDHVSIYRMQAPDSLPGVLLYARILGYLASTNGDHAAYELALRMLKDVLPTGDCEAVRLYGLTAARLGRWREAFQHGTKLLRSTRCPNSHTVGHRHDVNAPCSSRYRSHEGV